MIPASMKSEVYDVRVAVTADDVVCGECSYTTGSIEEQRIVCVHILPVVYLLSMLVCDGLA